MGIQKIYKILGRLMAALSFINRNEISFLHAGTKFIRTHVADITLKFYML
jgi:hypothetical protein